MFNIRKLALIPALALAAACAKDAPKQDVDAALANDLSLAGQAQPLPAQQFVSPTELAEAPAPEPAVVEAPAPAPRATASRSTSTRRVASSGTTRRRTTTPRRAPAPAPSPVDEGPSSGTVYETPAPSAPSVPSGTVVKRNTKRDAVIGAAAGAVLGAATSRDKVKGAVIGAAAGGLLGGIIGHTVDVKRTP